MIPNKKNNLQSKWQRKPANTNPKRVQTHAETTAGPGLAAETRSRRKQPGSKKARPKPRQRQNRI